MDGINLVFVQIFTAWFVLFDANLTVVLARCLFLPQVNNSQSSVALQFFLGAVDSGNRRNCVIPVAGMGFCFHFNVQAKCLNQTVHLLILYTLSFIQHITCMSQMIFNLSILLPRAVFGDDLPVATVFSEDVEEFASQACLPWFNQALGVDHQPAGLPVLMTSHYILRSWKRESRA